MSGLVPQSLYAIERDSADLEASYTFDEGNESGNPNPMVLDQGPAKNSGTVYGATYSPESKGFALSFNGKTSFAKCARPNRLLFSEDPFSVDFWIKLDSSKPGVVMGKKGEELDDAGWLIEVGESGQYLRVTLADGSRYDALEAPLVDGQLWHHVTVVRSDHNLMIYIDGKEAASKTGEASHISVSNPSVFLHLGKLPGRSQSFHGKLDDVAIWRRALNAEEVKQNYEKSRAEKVVTMETISDPSKGALLIHYRFDTDPKTIAQDLSGRGNDGKIVEGSYLPPEDGQPGALHFNGESTYIDIPFQNGLKLQGDMSFELWVRQNGTPKTKGAVIFGEASPASKFLFALGDNYNLLFSYLNDNSFGTERISLPVTRRLLGEEWAHLAVVVEYPRCRFYRDGQLVRDQYMPIPGIEERAGRPLRLGGEPVNSYFSPVDIREFRLYGRSLSAKEIAAHARGDEFSGEADEEIALEPDWYRNKLTVRYTTKEKGKSGSNVTLSLLSEGKAIANQTAALQDVSRNNSARLVAEASFTLNDLEGKTVEAQVAGEQTSQRILLAKPSWIHSSAGRSDKVPLPWVPVQIVRQSEQKLEIRVLGRIYQFEDSLLPSQISAANADLLASAMDLSAQIGGQKVEWERDAIKVLKTSDRAVELEQVWRRGVVHLTINATLEFDGFLQYRCIISSAEKVSFDSLILNVPLQPKHALFCYADRAYPLVDGNYAATFQSGAIRKPLEFQFSPNVWIGDDDRGLTWQAESDQYWNPTGSQKMLEVLPGKTSTEFRANFISKPSEVAPGKDRTYEFALLATPAKPLHRDAWSMRIARYEPWGTDFDLPNRTVNGRPQLQAIHETGVRHLFSFVTDAYAWPMPLHEKFAVGLSGLVKAAHAADVKVHPYVIHQRIAVEVPEFDLYGSRMANRPMKSYSQAITYPRNLKRPGSVALDYGADSSSTAFMCAKSEELRDAFVNNLEQRMEKFDEDGVYLDGTVHIGPLCFNEAHGCGYRDEEGKPHGTYPTFEIRKMMQRIYEVVKNHKPDGIVDVHCSYGFNPSGLTYADVMWTGEQWHHLRKTGTDYIAEELTLDKFRTEFTGRQLGIAAETLHYRLRNPMKIAATSLLHDISPRLSTGGFDNATQSVDSYFALIPKLWKMRDKFGINEAEKLWYWGNQDYVTVSSDQCYVTLFKHPKNGVLALVSNLSRNRQNVAARFNLGKLGLANPEISPIDALTGEAIAMTDGSISIPLESEAWKYVWLKPSVEEARP